MLGNDGLKFYSREKINYVWVTLDQVVLQKQMCYNLKSTRLGDKLPFEIGLMDS